MFASLQPSYKLSRFRFFARFSCLHHYFHQIASIHKVALNSNNDNTREDSWCPENRLIYLSLLLSLSFLVSFLRAAAAAVGGW